MLNFKIWLEGFRVNYSKLPEFLRAPVDDNDFEKFLQNPNNTPIIDGFDSMKLKRNEKEIEDELHRIEELIVFDIENNPGDFISASFSNELKTIEIKDSQKLNSFKSKILYGMKFEMKEEKIALYFKEKVEKLDSEYEKSEEIRRSIDIRLNEELQKIVINLYQNLLNKGTYFEEIKKYIFDMIAVELDKPEVKSLTGYTRYKLIKNDKHTSALMIGSVKLDWGKIQQIIKLSKISDPPKINQIRKKIKALKEIRDKFQNNVEYKNKWHNILQKVFLKKIKHPISAQDKELQEYFIRLSVENYVSFVKQANYDMVLFPESSSLLNKMIAIGISEYYNCEAVMGFRKREMATIDVHGFIKKNPNLPKEYSPDTGKTLLAGALERLKDLINSSRGEIKRIKINQAFIRNWNINSEIIKKINKKVILVVDDNLRSGGTFQSINKVLWNVGSPRYVNYYVPLWANFS